MPSPYIYLVSRTDFEWSMELAYAVLRLDLAATQHLLAYIAATSQDEWHVVRNISPAPIYCLNWLPPHVARTGADGVVRRYFDLGLAVTAPGREWIELPDDYVPPPTAITTSVNATVTSPGLLYTVSHRHGRTVEFVETPFLQLSHLQRLAHILLQRRVTHIGPAIARRHRLIT